MNTVEFKEMMFSRPQSELTVLRNAAANFGQDEDTALLMCKMYFPGMSIEKARLFLNWLAEQPASKFSSGRAR
jgi:hypothetical protein